MNGWRARTASLPDERRLRRGLLSYWRFDEGAGSTTADSVGPAVGTWAGTLGGQWVTPGAMGPACGKFNGTNNYVQVPTPAGIYDLATTGGLSVSLWVNKPTSASGNDAWVSYGNGAAAGQWSINYNSNFLTCALYNTASSFYVNRQSASGVLPIAAWTHVVQTVQLDLPNGPATVTQYINGARVGLASTTTPATTLRTGTPTGLYLGAFGTASSFSGDQLDEIIIYGRAITADEVQRLYNNGLGYDPTL